MGTKGASQAVPGLVREEQRARGHKEARARGQQSSTTSAEVEWTQLRDPRRKIKTSDTRVDL
ncbi:hypothetical protein HMPREF9004_0681 [Schaalia cardiffensis F0333]|uniref:Uncharacterized protein n=1 Tax=Schaalia cardiffensis F0333 TaxID=888050 RepID=N6X5E5_9ACTO|nr:hypothetical protein HMPREF9004_0681 [Schaalia cardiffensis F0333]